MDFITDLTQVLFALLVSATKFLTGPAVILSMGFSTTETILLTFSGGVLGSVVFYYLGAAIFNWWQRYFARSKKKTFNRRSRAIVRIKNRFGVWGMALLIPVISIPISCLISARYFKNDRTALPAYVVVVAVYSVLLTLFSKPIIEFFRTLF